MTDFILEAIAWGGYLGIALLMALENVVPPVPSEVIMGLGGMAVARGTMSMGPLVLWGTVGSVAGNYFWYALGRRFGYRGLKPFVDRWGRWLTLEWEDVEKLQRFFHSRGAWVVFVFRFLPTFRTMVSLPAGMACMPHWRFIIATFAGSAIWNTVLAWAGLYFGSNFRELEQFVGPVTIILSIVIVVGYVYRVMTWKPRVDR
ncbi:DedA family protein [Sphingomonas sp. 3-13AW]|jgi:membrane protein DedA with SNARE-associated domain|uniref:DedA family protein n=1 Tax=Sphingomonas sp. 3-13AW TaxID=3050450 RepID=UPI003BB50065